MAKISMTKTTLTVDGKRAGIRIDNGPWISTVSPDLIKIRCKKSYFPSNFKAAIQITNNSDMMEDYFEADTIKLMPGHPLYDLAKSLAA